MMCVLSTNLILAFSASNVEKDMACGSVQACIIFFFKKKKEEKENPSYWHALSRVFLYDY